MSQMIPGLDGLRAIAFLLVFALHTDYLQMGWVGVSLFFVLSGFLITGILLDMKQGFSSREYFLKFYGRRLLRIFPLYYFYLILIVLLTTWLISLPYRPRYMQIVLDQIWYAVLYVYDFFFGTAAFQKSHFLDHFWSLSVEEQFYIFWPLLILLVPERYLKKLFITFIILGPVFRLAMFFVHGSGVFRFLADSPALAIYPLPFSHMDAFAFGAYISRFPIPRAKQQFLLLLVILPAVGFASEYLATGTIGALSAFGYPLHISNAYKFIWAYSLLDYFFAVIIYGVAKEAWFTRFLEWHSLRYLGKISYGLYVYHYPIVWFSGRIADLGIEPPLLQPLTALIAISATILVASLSFHFLERPIINLKDRFFPLHSTERRDPSSTLEAEKTPLL
jgi:peptidoglycan/LPS O-acetylase OafA/YrhL